MPHFLLCYIPLHLLAAAYIACKLGAQKLSERGYLNVGDLIAIVVAMLVWPSGLLIVAVTCNVSLLNIEVYRRKP